MIGGILHNDVIHDSSTFYLTVSLPVTSPFFSLRETNVFSATREQHLSENINIRLKTLSSLDANNVCLVCIFDNPALIG